MNTISEYRLVQKLFDSEREADIMSSRCIPCGRSFGSERALEQHLQDSPAHAVSFRCGVCNRPFASDEALQQHIRDSPAHVPSFDSNGHKKSLGNDEALQQHIRNSPVYTPSFDCDSCNRSFGSEEALQQHIRDSPNHPKNTETPLDIFFRSFPTFNYDASLPPATSYANLQRHEGWPHKSAQSKDAWNRYQEALQNELHLWFGAENDLTAWHALCRAIGIDELPKTCEQCKEVVRRTHVNIVDLIAWGRSNREEKASTFRDLEALRVYTKSTRKIFHNTPDDEGGNIVLRHLLRRIF
ncbi:hypothetical protein EYC80_002638 [Monilinia laxa]|uniref:C2H2-type domain-containing protein n=1 Tax=Monilinia laxa TaxID=61186 RepID=A0A5N6K4Q9_MONLA|nr:hypothetical protein EYC80_002638 [Monilinia laxa]